eukprot:scaffold129078_cov45-Attheya_sp.AAC.2
MVEANSPVSLYSPCYHSDRQLCAVQFSRNVSMNPLFAYRSRLGASSSRISHPNINVFITSATRYLES